MGRRLVARGGAGGGEHIPATGQIGSRVATATAALALLGGIVVYSALAGDRAPQVVAGVGGAACALAALALAGRWPSLLPWGLAGVGASYAVYLSLRSGTVDPRAPLVGAAFFAAAELGFWSLEPFNGGADLVVLIRRVAFIALGSLCTAVLGGLLLVLAAGVNAGLALEALGVLAAVLTLTIVAVLASRSRESTSS